MTRVTIAISLLALCLCGCSAPVEYSQQQFREMETRVLEGSRNQVMESVLAVLQDGGYCTSSVDRQLGTITAHSWPKGYGPYVRRKFLVTVKIEEWSAGRVRTRTSFTSDDAVHKHPLFGQPRWEYSSRRISNPQLMLAFYAEVDRELFKRRQIDKQSGAPAPASPADRHGKEERR